jgi:lipopolysaccharide transport system ATP-binding protein
MVAAISIDNLGKCFQRQALQGSARYVTLREQLMNLIRGGGKTQAQDFWALKNVTFDVPAGKTVCIIGRNGAGKSTLLKILSRITKPTTGSARLQGRVGSLLEVGTGFHPELTGRENIYLNGSILGMSRREIKRHFDEIVAFAEIGPFLETPVKRYSSGMYTRLAFAVAAHLEPEILVIDEVLAVGDAEFQKKCLKKMGDVAGAGRTVLFVSHNMGAVQAVCGQVVLLVEGQVKMIGAPQKVVTEYLKVSEAGAGTPLSERRDRVGDGRFRFEEFLLLDAEGKPANCLVTGEDGYVCVRLSTPPFGSVMATPLDVSIIFRDFQGNKLTEVNTYFTNSSPRTPAAAREVRCLIPRLPILAGQYRIDLWCGTVGETQDWVFDAALVRIEQGNYFRNYEDARIPTAEGQGPIMIPQVWSAASGQWPVVSGQPPFAKR